MRPELLAEMAAWPHLLVVSGREDIQWMARHACAKGELRRILPGVYGPPGEPDLGTKAAAVALRHPDAVIVGSAAAALTWWPELPAPVVTACQSRKVAPAPGFEWRRWRVPPHHVVHRQGVRLATPALTVLDLIPVLGGRVIDEALRRRVVTLRGLQEAFTGLPRRAGDPERERLIADSCDEPWSEAERLFHRIVRGLDLPWAYRTNHRVRLSQGHAFLDLALPSLGLAFEVDGWAHHTDRATFVRDRTRDPELVERGWLIVRFAAITVEHDAAWVAARIQGIARSRAADLAAQGLEHFREWRS